MPKAVLVQIRESVYYVRPDGDRVYVHPHELACMDQLVTLGLLSSTAVHTLDERLAVRVVPERQMGRNTGTEPGGFAPVRKIAGRRHSRARSASIRASVAEQPLTRPARCSGSRRGRARLFLNPSG